MTTVKENDSNIVMYVITGFAVLMFLGALFFISYEFNSEYNKRTHEIENFLIKTENRLQFNFQTLDDCQKLNRIANHQLSAEIHKSWAKEMFDEGCPVDEYGAMIDPQEPKPKQ